MAKPKAIHRFENRHSVLAKTLRKTATPAEQKLWEQFQKLRLSHHVRFRRQQPIGPYIVDFYCAKHRCVVEIDGLSHEQKFAADEARDQFFLLKNIKILRFTEAETVKKPEAILETILASLHIPTPPPTPPSRGGANTISSAITNSFNKKTSAINLSLRDDYYRLLEKFGNPHKKLPPIIHVAGTNGKGSTIAFMRSMLEAEDKRVHTYTSPHLVTFNERIRIAGKLISDSYLLELQNEVDAHAQKLDLTFFEVTTAIAFLAFSQNPADALLLEVGLGGRLDATNVVETPKACVITRLSYDHCEYLGNSITEIATEKAGIIKKGAKIVIGPQSYKDAEKILLEKAEGASLDTYLYGRDWSYSINNDETLRFDFKGAQFHAPKPALLGQHQYANAATAAAALLAAGLIEKKEEALMGLARAEWPARLQRLTRGPLLGLLPEGSELWLDGGHNDTAGEVLAQQVQAWQKKDHRPLYAMCGMMGNKDAEAFLKPLAPFISGFAALPIPGEDGTMPASTLAAIANKLGLISTAAASPQEAAAWLTQKAKENGQKPARFLMTGSLYLAGHILANHG